MTRSTVSPKIESMDQFTPDLYNSGSSMGSVHSPQQMISDFLDTSIKPEYNADMASQLSLLQSWIESGMEPGMVDVNISSDEQMADINKWLTDLSNNIPFMQGQQHSQPQPSQPYYMQDMSMDMDTSPVYPQENQEQHQQPQNYTDIILQSFNMANMDGAVQYPSSAEQDMYVRSHPIQPAEASQQQPQPPAHEANYYNEMYPTQDDMDTISPSRLNMHLQQQQQELQQHQQPWDAYPSLGMTTGNHYMYTMNPDIRTTGFVPQIQTALAFQRANKTDLSDTNPTDSQTKKQDQPPSPVQPKKDNTMVLEDKKMLATMVNVFASPDAPAKPTSTKPKDVSPPSSDKKNDPPLISCDVLDLLVSDMSELKVDDEDNHKPESAQDSTEPDSKDDDDKEDADGNKLLYPTKAAMDIQQQHYDLLVRIRAWVNKGYEKKKTHDNTDPSNKPAEPTANSIPVN
ncbi:hypothetical protein DM01DRAFT_1046277 [Hesseltinella vesiculosa]|uniref:Uncharacterized protein n=1 Tax=Hesseltinella vesiculosa TaxID=101127 RepID=A0A1X2GH14_9FUNG|nr:hypothetical protein DM01DRAFT_1046277 [Hesseltinella vesiculosa]